MSTVPPLKPIPTRYNGYRFRSRLEARWAVFFDRLGIAYQYEPEGFELSDGSWYLPDFWLPSFHGGTWVEVKGSGDFAKAEVFAKQSDHYVWYANGQPGYQTYEMESRHDFLPGCVPLASEARDEDRMYWWAHTEFAWWTDGKQNYCHYHPSYEDREYAVVLTDWLLTCGGERVLAARAAARAARFEHGEIPVKVAAGSRKRLEA